MRLRLILPIALLAAPAAAQDGGVEEGFGLMERGMDLMLRGLIDDMGPAIADAQGTLRVLEDVLGNLDEYETPEILPNGDVLIRRKRPLGPDGEPEGGELDL